jgi:hypothetical protein
MNWLNVSVAKLSALIVRWYLRDVGASDVRAAFCSGHGPRRLSLGGREGNEWAASVRGSLG